MLANTIKMLSEYSEDILELDIRNKNINGMFDLLKFNSLIKLDCFKTQVTNFLNLPSNLLELNCSFTDMFKRYILL